MGHGAIPKGKVHPNNPTSPRRLTAAKRRVQVMEYKLLGASERQIAEKLGMSQPRVHEIICEELQRNSEKTRLATEQYRQLHLEQLDAMEMGLMQQARTGDVFAVDRIIRIQTQRASLLAGLAVPTKIAAGVGGLDGDGNNPSGGAPVILQLTPRRSEDVIGLFASVNTNERYRGSRPSLVNKYSVSARSCVRIPSHSRTGAGVPAPARNAAGRGL